jgi:hypothetical protein
MPGTKCHGLDPLTWLFSKGYVFEIHWENTAPTLYEKSPLDPQRSPKWTHQCSLKRTLPMRTHW